MLVKKTARLLPATVVGTTKEAAHQLKEFTRNNFSPLFRFLKAGAVGMETIAVRNALKKLARIQDLSSEQLKDVDFLADLITTMGLHGSTSAVSSADYEWPSSLDASVGKGLQIWQYPTQFSKYLAFLSQFQIRSHLEIGVSYGGTFVFSVEYLNRLNPGLDSYCIDVVPPSLLVQQFARQRAFTYITAKSCDLYQHLKPETTFDLVFVDGDHSRDGVMNDFYLVREKTKIITFHDIVNFRAPGSIEAWQEVKCHHANEFDFFEFIDQYDELLIKNPGKRLLGIGVAVKKGLLS